MMGGTSGAGVAVHFRGSFTGPFSEALVELVRCESHAMWYGGTVVVREKDGGWVPVAYVPGFLPDTCELRRAPDGVDRLACRENHGENGGSYMTAATVVDLHTRREQDLLGSECEDARDVNAVHWSTSTGFDVSVTVLHGMHRINDGACRDAGGHARTSTIQYVEHDDRYEPDARTMRLLLTLLPASSPELSPAVAAATGARPRLPKEISPTSRSIEMLALGKCP